MWTYQPQLDGLRTVAVYLVLLYHADVALLGGGFVGVDLFFVLSGFLVTNVILAEIDAKGSFRLGAFYARRVRRLLPAAVVVVIATSLVFVLVADVARRTEMVGDARAALLYVANWHFLAQSTDYFSADLAPSPFLHFWSLAIEEQFYLVFPVLLLLLLRGRSGFARRATVVITLATVASVLSQLYWGDHEVNHAYYGTDARLYQLLAGSLLALALHGRSVASARRSRVGLVTLGLLAAAGLLTLGTDLLDLSPTARGLGAAAASVALIASLSTTPGSALGWLLSRSLPVYLGTISYGTYLWHWPVILVLREALDPARPAVVAGLALVLSTALAALSHQVLEQPVRTNRWLVRITWPVAVTGVATSAVVAAFVVAPILESPRKPVLAASRPTTRASTLLGAEKVPDLDYAALDADAGNGLSCAPDDIESCTAVAGSGKVVLLVGDSYANMLDPMFRELAADHGFTLVEDVVPACPWPEDILNTDATEVQQDSCRTARVGWYDEVLKELHPDLVVLINHQRDLGASFATTIRSRTRGGERLDALTLRAMSETTRTVSRYSGHVVILKSYPVPQPVHPLHCLAAADRVRDCAFEVPTVRPPSDGYAEALAAGLPNVSAIDLDPIVCPDAPVCLPYRDGAPVFRDRLHLLTTFAIRRRAEVWDLFSKAGAVDGL